MLKRYFMYAVHDRLPEGGFLGSTTVVRGGCTGKRTEELSAPLL